jgi:8-oxo-dGTP pyrophosphatase MutT (NUDIX family)
MSGSDGSTIAPSDSRAPKFPVSIKAVLVIDGQVPLLENERREWELPGGKLEPGESPRACLAREVEEELGIEVEVGPILDSWLYAVAPGVEVVIITYLCFARAAACDLRLSAEHKRLGRFAGAHVADLVMPQGYKRSIRQALLLTGAAEA